MCMARALAARNIEYFGQLDRPDLLGRTRRAVGTLVVTVLCRRALASIATELAAPWILSPVSTALLYDITGLVDPNTVDGAIGSADYAAYYLNGGGIAVAGGQRRDSPSASAQQQLLEEWRRMRSLVELEDH